MHGSVFRVGRLILALISIALQTQPVFGLGMEAFGPAGDRIGRQASWPKGVGGLLSHQSRVYWRDVNGDDHSYYSGGVSEVNELLALFSKVDIKHRQVVLLAGSPTVSSFRGEKTTPYSVEFHLPGGLYFMHAKEHSKTGMYPTKPRLLIHVPDDWADDLAKLEIPKNVVLYKEAFDTRLLLKAAAEGSDQRSRAIQLLGNNGSSTPEVKALLETASKSDVQYVSKTARIALERWEADPERNALQSKVTAFVEGHPQCYRIPTPESVLAKLQAIDEQLVTEGFTASGTLVDSSKQMMNWTVTMGKNNLVIRETAAVKEATGRISNTIFKNDERMGSIQQSQMWVKGKLNKTKAFKSFEPVGKTYDLLIGRILWPLGRGFTSRISEITEVTPEADGTLFVEAKEGDGLKIRWELIVDPEADYVIRQARGFRRDEADPEYIVDAAGVLESDDRVTNHTSRWIEGVNGQTVSFAVHTVSSKPDVKLIFEVEQSLREQDE